MFANNLNALNTEAWKEHIPLVEGKLKPELQTAQGFLRVLRSEFDDNRKNEIQVLLNSFLNSGVTDLDNRIESFTSQLLRINHESQLPMQYELIGTILKYPDLSSFPCLEEVQKLFQESNLKDPLCQRVIAILFKLANQSISQSNKSNAGQAGEVFVEAILSSVGLVKDEHYRVQYASESGSDTDIAFPCVSDFEDSKLEVLAAVQMSTNDRARLTSSELKKGVVGYVITGNGMKASSKRLRDIGTQIVSKYHDDKIRMVCFRYEIDSELKRITEAIEKSPDKNELVKRKEYFSDFAISFEEFAQKMSRFQF